MIIPFHPKIIRLKIVLLDNKLPNLSLKVNQSDVSNMQVYLISETLKNAFHSFLESENQ